MDAKETIRKWMEQAGCQKIRDTGIDNFVSTCPFHGDRHPSFSMRADNGLFVCYSQGCGVSGNLINFLISALHWPFKRAKRAVENLSIPSLDDPNVFTLPEYGSRAEVEQSRSTITEGHLGLYDFCPRYMLRRGFHRDVLRAWGIGYDYGTSRVTIPVRDSKGKLVGVSKRATLKHQEDHSGKYLHLGFRKSLYLYGAERCTDWRTKVVVEGQVDALAISQLRLGVDPLATMGAKVSRRQIELLSRYPGKIVLAFDNDKDGKAALSRVGDELVRRIGRNQLLAVRWPDDAHDFGDLVRDRDRAREILLSAGSYNDVMLEMLFK